MATKLKIKKEHLVVIMTMSEAVFHGTKLRDLLRGKYGSRL